VLDIDLEHLDPGTASGASEAVGDAPRPQLFGEQGTGDEGEHHIEQALAPKWPRAKTSAATSTHNSITTPPKE
jgi:hypothetical protein